MKHSNHFCPVQGRIGMREIGPDRRDPIPDFPDERLVRRVPDEDVHLEADVERRIGSGSLGSGNARIDDRNVMHSVLQIQNNSIFIKKIVLILNIFII